MGLVEVVTAYRVEWWHRGVLVGFADFSAAEYRRNQYRVRGYTIRQ